MPDWLTTERLILPLAVGLVAFLYSSVGHGGATGYLAVAALLGIAPTMARPGALWMNCCVAGIAFWRFQRAGFFDLKTFLSLAATSVPCAWLGSRMQLHGGYYAVLLGAALAAAGWFLARGRAETVAPAIRPMGLPLALAAGAGLGFLAGLTGIGGGVFLTPLLIFLHWTPAKVAGGISALFIVVNSAAGLAGLGRGALIWEPALMGAVLLGVIGAFAGTHCGIKRWPNAGYRRALAFVLWIAAAKLVITGK